MHRMVSEVPLVLVGNCRLTLRETIDAPEVVRMAFLHQNPDHQESMGRREGLAFTLNLRCRVLFLFINLYHHLAEQICLPYLCQASHLFHWTLLWSAEVSTVNTKL